VQHPTPPHQPPSPAGLAPADFSRRQVLVYAGAALVAGAALGTCQPAWSQQAAEAGAPPLGEAFWAGDRKVRLRHSSGDFIEQPYVLGGRIFPTGYVSLCWFLRDRVVGDAVTIDVTLLDILYGIRGWLDYFDVRSEIVATSGHRNRRRNARIEGAALDSRHITGQAVDLYIPGVDPLLVARFARWLGAGGIGWYPQRGFVHLDTGTRRSWRG